MDFTQTARDKVMAFSPIQTLTIREASQQARNREMVSSPFKMETFIKDSLKTIISRERGCTPGPMAKYTMAISMEE